MMKITFKYQIKGEKHWRVLNLKPEEYFDQDDKYDLNSSPKHSNFHEYLTYSKVEILFIHIIIETEYGRRDFKQSFWNDGNNFIIERIDSVDRDYREIIISSLIDNEKKEWETLRIVSNNHRLFPAYHGVIRDELDGTQSERKLDLQLFKELFKSISLESS